MSKIKQRVLAMTSSTDSVMDCKHAGLCFHTFQSEISKQEAARKYTEDLLRLTVRLEQRAVFVLCVAPRLLIPHHPYPNKYKKLKTMLEDFILEDYDVIETNQAPLPLAELKRKMISEADILSI